MRSGKEVFGERSAPAPPLPYLEHQTYVSLFGAIGHLLSDLPVEGSDHPLIYCAM